MCGICLIYNTQGNQPESAMIERMIRAIKHRGPDDDDYVIDQNAALGHTRLSIVDIKLGHQPMSTKDGRFVITYNGEIYNYQSLKKQLQSNGTEFVTQSDTEVVLQLFVQQGQSSIKKLRGMFSFAIYDRQKNKLFVVRDRLGIKPLFYHWDGEWFYAASEIKSIFASGAVEPALNKQSIGNFFKYQFSVAPYTVFENIFELPPGHFLTIEKNTAPAIEQYWDISFPYDSENEIVNEQKCIDEFEQVLNDAAGSHTIGDVPICAYLSGGIDSATTTSLLKKHYPETVQTYTIAFSNKENDESEIAKSIADYLSVPNNVLYLDDNKEGGFLDDFIQAIYHLEQPQRVAVDIPHFLLSGLVRENNNKVVYTGDGSDEIFGGYDCYRQDAIRDWANQLDDEPNRRENYFKHYGQYFSRQHLEHLLDMHQPDNQDKVYEQFGCYPAWNDYWHVLDPVAADLLSEDYRQEMQHETQMATLAQTMKANIEYYHPLNQSLYIEMKTRLPGWILWKSDRLSMAHGVEARVPFMDHPLVEYCAELPPVMKLNGMDEKYVLRKLMLSKLPEHPTQYKKRAFYTPIREWFFETGKVERLNHYFSKQQIEECGAFNYEQVQKYLHLLTTATKPKDMDEYYSQMKLEWGLMIVLSTQILHELFIKKQADCFIH